MRIKILFALGGVLAAASTAAAGPFTLGDVFASFKVLQLEGEVPLHGGLNAQILNQVGKLIREIEYVERRPLSAARAMKR